MDAGTARGGEIRSHDARAPAGSLHALQLRRDRQDSEGRSQQNQYPELLRYKINSLLYIVESEDVLREAIASVGPETLLSGSGRTQGATIGLSPVDQIVTTLEQWLSFPTAMNAEGNSGSAAAGGRQAKSDSLSDQAFLSAKKRLLVNAEKDSQVLKLSFRHENPEIAERFLKVVVEAFLQRQVKLSGSADAPSFFRSQAERYRDEYGRASAKLRAFAETHATYSIEQEMVLALSRRDEAVAALATTRGSIADKVGQVATLQNTLTQLRQRISLPSEIVGPKTNMPADSDPLTSNHVPANESPLLLVRVFQETAQSLVNLNASIVGLRALEAEQSKALSAVDARLAALSSDKAEFERVKSEVDQASSILDAHLKRMADAQLTADWDASEKLSNVKVLQSATLPLRPVFPQKAFFMALSTLVGLAGGVASSVGLSMLAPRRRRVQPRSVVPQLRAEPPNDEAIRLAEGSLARVAAARRRRMSTGCHSD
jgi:polysaccharide biosynthesis transport protein